MPGISHLRALIDGHVGYTDLLPGRIGSIISERRPAFVLEGDVLENDVQLPADEEFEPVDGNWKALVSRAAAAVGRIEVPLEGREPVVVGTCFRIGADRRRIATAAHIAPDLVEQGGKLDPGIDPRPKPARKRFRAAQAVFEARPGHAEERHELDGIELLHGQLDLMLCRLKSPSGREPLELGSHPTSAALENVPVCVVGYPVTPPEANEELIAFETLFMVNGVALPGIKRASPGLIDTLAGAFDADRCVARHDATTLRGSSGSPAISLVDGRLIGLHFWGEEDDERNKLVYLPGVCLDAALLERLDERAPHPPQDEPGPWPNGQRRVGRALLGSAPVEDGSESALAGTSPPAVPPASGESPAVLADRRDIRDRFYVPSLRDPKPEVMPERGASDRVLRQTGNMDCTGHALATAIDRQLDKQRRGVEGGVDPRMLYEMARLHDEFVDDQPGGTSLRGAIKGFYHNGACPRPLASASPGGSWSLSVAMAKAARSISLGAYYRLRPSLPDFQMAVQEAGAVIVSAWLHSGWRRPKAGRIEHRLDRKPAHAFVLVGYDSDGFIVQNSWGTGWGGFRDRAGFAHWSYADWAANVIDAWVLQPAPSAPEAHSLPLRSYAANDAQLPLDLDVEIAALPEPRRMAIIGHIAHAERSGLVDAGRVGVGQQALRETALYLSTDEVWRESAYGSLAFVFHDPFLGAEATARLSAHLNPRLKAAGVYAMNILYGADELRSLSARMRDEAEFSRRVTGGSGENLTAYLERRARRVGRPLFDTFVEGLEESARPGGAIWQTVASLCLEAVHRPGGTGDRRDRRALHAIAFGVGSLAARAAFRGENGEGFVDERDGTSLSLDSVSLLAPVTRAEAPGDEEGNGWPMRGTSRPLELQLAPQRPQQTILPGYDGDWCDLADALLGPGGHRPRREGGRARGHDRLVRLAIDPDALNAVMRNVLGGRSPKGWQRF